MSGNVNMKASVVLTRSLVGLGCIASLFQICSCTLFEDQKGSNNWISKQLGRVNYASVLRESPSILVASEQGVLALLNLRDGAIQWRKNLLDEGISQFVVSEAAGAVYTVDGDGSTLRAWAATSAQLYWEASLLRAPASDEPAVVMAYFSEAQGEGDQDYVAVIAGGSVTAYAATSGAVLWKRAKVVQKSSTHASIRRVGSVLHVSGAIKGSADIHYAQLDAQTGEVVTSAVLVAPSPTSAHAATDDAIVLISDTSKQLCEIRWPSTAETASLSCQELSSAGEPVRLQSSAHTMLVESGSTVKILDTTTSPSSMVSIINNVAAVSAITSDGERMVVAVAVSKDSQCSNAGCDAPEQSSELTHSVRMFHRQLSQYFADMGLDPYCCCISLVPAYLSIVTIQNSKGVLQSTEYSR